MTSVKHVFDYCNRCTTDVLDDDDNVSRLAFNEEQWYSLTENLKKCKLFTATVSNTSGRQCV